MRKKRKDQEWFNAPEVAERAIMLQVLRSLDDHSERWTQAELRAEIDDIDPGVIDAALERLEAHGLVHSSDGMVWASASGRHLDYLGMVSV